MAGHLPKSLASWSLIRSFLSLAYFLEYGPAARELGVSVPTLRRRIQRLESFLGSSQLVYERRTLQLTEAGLKALEIASHADRRIAAIRDNEDQVRSVSMPPLRLSMDDNVLTYFWIPFCLKHSALLENYQISVQVDRVPDFSAGSDTDFAFSLGNPPQSAGKTEPVGSFGVYFAGHEAYVAAAWTADLRYAGSAHLHSSLDRGIRSAGRGLADRYRTLVRRDHPGRLR